MNTIKVVTKKILELVLTGILAMLLFFSIIIALSGCQNNQIGLVNIHNPSGVRTKVDKEVDVEPSVEVNVDGSENKQDEKSLVKDLNL